MSESSWRKFVELVRSVPTLPIEDDVLKKAAELAKENPDLTLPEVAEKIGIDKGALNRKVKKFIQIFEPEVKESRSIGEVGLKTAGGRVSQLSVKILDTGIAKTLEEHLSKLIWFSEALNRIGFVSLLATLSIVKIDPQEFLRKVSEFENADRFVNEFLKYLNAIYIAAVGGGDEVERMRKEVERCRNEATLWRIIAMDAAKRVYYCRTALYEVLTIMCPDCRLRYALLMYMKYYTESLSRGGLEKEKQTVEKVE